MRTVGAEAVYWLRSRLRWGAEVSKNQDASVAKAKKAAPEAEAAADAEAAPKKTRKKKAAAE